MTPQPAPSTPEPTSSGLPTSFYLWGARQDDLDRAALHVALALDPGFRWLEILPADRPDPDRLAWLHRTIGPERLVLVRHPGSFVPHLGAREPAKVDSLLRPDPGGLEVTEALDFVESPDAIQELLGSLVPDGNRRVLVIANIDRLAPYWQASRTSFEPIVRTCNRMGITPIAIHMGPAHQSAISFAYELRIPSDGFEPSLRPVPVCARGGPDHCVVLNGLPRSVILCRREVPGADLGRLDPCDCPESKLPLIRLVPSPPPDLAIPPDAPGAPRRTSKGAPDRGARPRKTRGA